MTTTTHITINNEIETIVRGWAGDTVKADLTKTKRVDALRAAGWTSAHCISPKSEGSAATDETWAFLKATINSGFPKQAQAMMEMSAKGFGIACVVGDRGKLLGVISDGDIRRHAGRGLMQTSAGEIATKSPKTVAPDILAAQALALMNPSMIGAVVVVDTDEKPIGILRVHDCLKAGVA